MQFAILLNYTPPKYVEYSSVIWQDSSSWAIALSRIVKNILLSPTPLPLSEHSESNFCVRCNFLCGLGNYSAASLLTRDGGACAAQPGLIVENLSNTPRSIRKHCSIRPEAIGVLSLARDLGIGLKGDPRMLVGLVNLTTLHRWP